MAPSLPTFRSRGIFSEVREFCWCRSPLLCFSLGWQRPDRWCSDSAPGGVTSSRTGKESSKCGSRCNDGWLSPGWRWPDGFCWPGRQQHTRKGITTRVRHFLPSCSINPRRCRTGSCSLGAAIPPARSTSPGGPTPAPRSRWPNSRGPIVSSAT